MTKLFEYIDIVLLKLSKLLINIASICLLIWPFIVVLYVILRYFNIANWLFVEEFTEYSLVIFTYFSLAFALREDAHIRIDTIVMHTPENIQKVLNLIINAISFIICGFLFAKSLTWLKDGYIMGSRSHYPSSIILWPIYLIVSIGMIVLTLEFLIKTYRNARDFSSKL